MLDVLFNDLFFSIFLILNQKNYDFHVKVSIFLILNKKIMTFMNVKNKKVFYKIKQRNKENLFPRGFADTADIHDMKRISDAIHNCISQGMINMCFT